MGSHLQTLPQQMEHPAWWCPCLADASEKFLLRSFFVAAGTLGLSRGVSHPTLKTLEGRAESFLKDYERPLSLKQVNFSFWLEPQIVPQTCSAPTTALCLRLVSSPACFPAVSPGLGWHTSTHAETLTKLSQSTLD